MTRRRALSALLLGSLLLSCAARLPALEEVNEVVLRLREYHGFAWGLGLVAIWADLALPVPQTAVIAALGILYGTLGGGLLGSAGLISAGLFGYALARRYGRGPVARLVGERSLGKVEALFDRAGVWAIVLTRSLPYSIPEAVVCAAGLARMRASRLLVASSLGSVPTAFAFAAIGAGWDEEPALALAVSYLLPIPLVPLTLYLLRRSGSDAGEGAARPGGDFG
jgi:uncharacterized membrane protein YdjX (TVP38/TMEM64 family)